MAYDLDNVKAASYKEVPFLMDVSTINGGRKDVVHEFVNSDKQVVEDLGLKRRSFSITAIIHGDDYEIDKDRLLTALQNGRKGTFVHPFEGNLENMVVRTFTMTEDFKEFGVATFSINFAPSDDIASPTRSSFSLSEVSSQRLSAGQIILDDFRTKYSVDPALTGSIEDAIETNTNFIEDFNESISRGLQGTTDIVNSLSTQILFYELNIASLIQAPSELADSIGNLFTTANNAFPIAAQTLDIMQSLFNFGSDRKPQLIVETAAIEEINKNNDVFDYSINSLALVNAYFQLTRAEFDTVTEIERQESVLEDQYDLITNLETLPREIRNALTDLRAIASLVIDETKTTTPNLIEIEVVNETSIRKLEYLFYGENTRTDTLISINKIQDIGFVVGDVDILNDNF